MSGPCRPSCLRISLLLVALSMTMIILLNRAVPIIKQKVAVTGGVKVVTFDEDTGQTNDTPSRKITSHLVDRTETAKLSAVDTTSKGIFKDFDYSRGSNEIGIEDVFIAIKTTVKNHPARLPLLMDTWIPQALSSVGNCFIIRSSVSANSYRPTLAV